MSEVWRRRVWAMADRTDAADRLALLALAELADAGGACRTGQRRLARMCGVGIRAVQATLGRVEAAGYLAVERVAGEANTYRLRGERIVGEAIPGDAVDAGAAASVGGAVDDGGGDGVRDGGRGAASDGRGSAAGDGAGGAAGDGGGPRAATPPAYSAPTTLKDMQHAQASGDGQAGEPARLGEVVGGATTAAVGTEGLTGLLRARGVDAPVATRLAEDHPDRVRPLVERFDRERAEKALGPGWLVSAIRGGWSAGAPTDGAAPGRLLTYAEMLHACERTGVTTDDFEAVPRPGQRPLWRRRD